MKQKHPIQRIWFDMSETLAVYSPEFTKVRDKLLFEVYANVINKPVSDELKQEVLALRDKHGSNAAIFHAMGLPKDYWPSRFGQMDHLQYFEPNEHICNTLKSLRDIVPISLFTNSRPEKILRAIGIDINWFSKIIGAEEIPAPKPDIRGYKLMIATSQLPPENILYVGDDIKKDILPAKSLGIQTALMWGRSNEADYSFERFEDILELFK